MMALFFAMIDFPFALYIQNTIREGAREGVRFAITQQTGSNGQDAAILAVVESYSQGFINAAALARNSQLFDQLLQRDDTRPRHRYRQ